MSTNPKLAEHGAELALLGIIAIIIGILLITVVIRGVTGWDVAACLLVLQSIIGAIKDRWNARLQGQSNELLGAAAPGASPSATEAAAVARTTEADATASRSGDAA